MVTKLFIGLILCCTCLCLKAQDSTSYKAIVERMDQVQTVRNSFYKIPALRPYLYQYSATPVDISYLYENKELYHQQLGKGDQGFRIATSSYQNNTFDGYTIWGDATYENYKSKQVRFNETSDYNLVFPYVTSDSIGGDLFSETYQFSGGIAKEIHRWTLGIQGGYKANLSHRKVDPRPNNNSSDLQMAAGASYRLFSDYVLSANVGFRYYKQRNLLKFVRVLGRPPVVYLNGLGSYNSLLSGFSDTNDAILYELIGAEASLTLVPKENKGWFAHIGWKQFNGYRILSKSRDHSNDWMDHYLEGRLGYSAENSGLRYGFLGAINLQTKKGIEGLFSNQGNDIGYQKISELSSYRYYNFNYQLDAFIGRSNWSVKPYVSYVPFKEQYLTPFREQAIDKMTFGIQGQILKEINSGLLGFSLNLKKEKVIRQNSFFSGTKPGSGLADLLLLNNQYLIAEPFSLFFQGRYDFMVTKDIKPFLSFQAQKTWKTNQELFGVNFGLIF